MPKQDKEDPFVQFCRSSWGMDYHDIVGKKLQLLEDWLKEHISGIEVIGSVDTGVFNDRAVALRSGIGFSGKNSSIINVSIRVKWLNKRYNINILCKV